jgi:lipid A 3-O-deacylase
LKWRRFIFTALKEGGKMRKYSFFFIFSCYLLLPIIASAESFHKNSLISEIRVGIMEHDVATRANKHEDGQDLNSEFFFRSPDLKVLRVVGSPRPSLGISINSNNDTSQLYTGLNWDVIFFDRSFVSIGLGGSLHNGELQSTDPDRQRLGSRALFRAAIAAGFNINSNLSVSAMFDHVSNGRTAYPNNGLEKFGIQFGFSY